MIRREVNGDLLNNNEYYCVTFDKVFASIMIGKRNLRNRAVLLEKMNEVSKKNSVLPKCKLKEKENVLPNSEEKGLNDFKKQKKCEKQKTILGNSVVNVQKIYENTADNKVVGQRVNENKRARRPKLEVLKQNNSSKEKNCPMKENEPEKIAGGTKFTKKKNVVTPSAPTLKENVDKGDILYPKGIKSKECEQTSTKVQSKKKSVFNEIDNKKSYLRKSLDNSKKVIETKLSAAKCTKRFPIWKRNLNGSRQGKKRSNVDVYDISLDEEIILNEVKVKKKKINRKKNDTNNTNRTKKCLPLSTKNRNRKKKILPNLKTASTPILKTDQIIPNVKLPSAETEKMTTLVDSLPSNKDDNSTLPLEDNPQHSFFASSDPDNLIEIVEQEDLDLQSAVPKVTNKVNVPNLVVELERSFLMPKPKMTSTPDAVHSKPGTQAYKGDAVKVTNISNIPASNGNCLNTTVSTPISPSNNNVLKKADKYNGDITLFESPEKPNKNERKGKKLVSPKKTVQINLFGEILRSPSSEDSLEDSVLMPYKAYHTPDNFKSHLVRTKRVAENVRKEPKKSKQDTFIENMVQHFDEIGDTELCIE